MASATLPELVPVRDAVGLAFAYADDDDGRLAEILGLYGFTGDDLHLLMGVLALVVEGRDADELETQLWTLALGGAGNGRRPR